MPTLLRLALATSLVFALGCENSETTPPTDTGTSADTAAETAADAPTDAPVDVPTDSAGDSGSVDSSPADSAGDAPSDGEVGDAPSGPTCAAYCDKIMAACTGANAQYASRDACVSTCVNQLKLRPGSASDTSGNTIGCRTYHAGAAVSDPGMHCYHAGATGGNVCGTWCEVYCDVVMANCTGANAVFASAAACATSCAGFPTTGKPGDTTGNSVQCRLYHAPMAAGDPATHCPHAGPTGGGVCI